MNRTLGAYHDDERGHYTFSYLDNDGKHITVSFRAEPEYDLDIVFQEFRNFLIASNHDVEGSIGELNDEDDYDNSMEQSWEDDSDEVHAMTQYQAADKFTMDHFPNNGWPFGGLTTASIAALTTADIAPLSVTNLETNQTYTYKDIYGKFPTMAPITSQQVQAWALSSEQIRSFTAADLADLSKMAAPGTIGGAKIEFK
jgi:hypothetical protein